MQIELSSVVQFMNKNFLDLTSIGKVFACSVHEKNEHCFVMKGYYEKFCYEVYKVVIFLREDSVMQKSILTCDEMVLNFFITTIANFIYEGCFINL